MAKKNQAAKAQAEKLAQALHEAQLEMGMNYDGDKIRGIIQDSNKGFQEAYYPGKRNNTATTMPTTAPATTAPAPTLEQQTNSYNQDILNAMQGLPGLFAEDIGGAIGYRGGLRDYFAKTLPGLDTEGLTEADYTELNTQNLADRKNVESYMRSLLQDTTGRLRSQGFASSNLAGRELGRSVYKPLGDTLVNLDAAQSARRQNLLNARAGRRQQNFGTMLTSAGVLGQGSPAQLSSSFVNPSLYGGFTAPQAFDAAITLRGGDVGLRSGYDQNTLGAGLRPTLQSY